MFHIPGRAADTTLEPLDRIQLSFFREVGLDVQSALLDFHMGPLSQRRDISMLGLLHKCVLGCAHPSLCQMFAPAPSTQIQSQHATRLARHRHNRQINDVWRGGQLDIVRRSLLGLIKVYNILPQQVVDAADVHIFQKRVTSIIRRACEDGVQDWQALLSPRKSSLSFWMQV